MTTVFDIETLPASPETILSLRGEFSRDKLKPPSTHKKPETIDAWYAEQEKNWLTPDDAGLKPIYSQIAIAGFANMSVSKTIDIRQFYDGCGFVLSEKGVIQEAWNIINQCDLVIGYAIDFDLSMLISRSVICGIPVPRGVRKGRFLGLKFQCLMQMIHGSEYVSLESTLRACGMESKTGDGSKFAELWAKDRDAALLYNEADCRAEFRLAQRVGMI